MSAKTSARLAFAAAALEYMLAAREAAAATPQADVVPRQEIAVVKSAVPRGAAAMAAHELA